MHVSEVQGPKVTVKWSVSQLVVNVEEEGIMDVLRGLGVRNPVQLVYT